MESNRLHIIEIWKNGESSLGSKKWIVNVFLFLFAVLISFLGLRVSDSYLDVIIGSLSIFTGFYFTLIVYVTDKSVGKMNEITNRETEPSKILSKFIADYKSFSKTILSQISFSIVMAIALIFIALLTQLLPESSESILVYGCNLSYAYQLVISVLFFYLCGRLVHMILLIISNMQAFFHEEFNNSNDIL